MTLQKINSMAGDCCGGTPATHRTWGSVFGTEKEVSGEQTVMGEQDTHERQRRALGVTEQTAGSHGGQSETNTRPFCCLQWDLLLGLAHMIHMFTDEPQREMSWFGA